MISYIILSIAFVVIIGMVVSGGRERFGEALGGGGVIFAGVAAMIFLLNFFVVGLYSQLDVSRTIISSVELGTTRIESLYQYQEGSGTFVVGKTKTDYVCYVQTENGFELWDRELPLHSTGIEKTDKEPYLVTREVTSEPVLSPAMKTWTMGFLTRIFRDTETGYTLYVPEGTIVQPYEPTQAQ